MTPRPFRFAVQSYNADSPQDWRDRARRAEALGYSALHLADHYLGDGPALKATSHPHQQYASLPMMVAAAEATSTLRIGARVFCIDYRPLAVLVKEVATLDWLSGGGRVEFGLGLGLSIVQTIVRHHGGTINFESKPGQTVFTIELPVSARISDSAKNAPM